MSLQLVDNDHVAKLLKEACAQKMSIEVHYRHRRTRKLSVGRARLLAIQESALLADQLRYRSGCPRIPEREDVTAFVATEGEQFSFRTSIKSTRTRLTINNRRKLMGISLEIPELVERGQRREDSRVSVAPLGIKSIRIVRALDSTEGDGNTCPIDGFLGNGHLVNISGGGLALLIDIQSLPAVEIDERFILGLKLPGMDKELTLLSRVCHASEVQSSESVLVGFAFEDCDGEDEDAVQLTLSQMIAELERRML